MKYRRILALVTVLMSVSNCSVRWGRWRAATATASRGHGRGGLREIEEMEVGHPGLPPDFIQMMLPLAIELGYMRDDCWKSEIIDFESGVAAFRAMAAGEFDMGLSGSVSPILATVRAPMPWGSPPAGR